MSNLHYQQWSELNPPWEHTQCVLLQVSTKSFYLVSSFQKKHNIQKIKDRTFIPWGLSISLANSSSLRNAVPGPATSLLRVTKSKPFAFWIPSTYTLSVSSACCGDVYKENFNFIKMRLSHYCKEFYFKKKYHWKQAYQIPRNLIKDWF